MYSMTKYKRSCGGIEGQTERERGQKVIVHKSRREVTEKEKDTVEIKWIVQRGGENGGIKDRESGRSNEREVIGLCVQSVFN